MGRCELVAERGQGPRTHSSNGYGEEYARLALIRPAKMEIPVSTRGGKMQKVLPLVFVFSFALLPLAAQAQLPPPASGPVDYEKDVKPLLAQNCYSCHGPECSSLASGSTGDRMRSVAADYGPVIVPGKSADSKLIHRLVSGDGGIQMPPTGALLPEEIGVLRAWIDQGADITNDVAEEAPAEARGSPPGDSDCRQCAPNPE